MKGQFKSHRHPFETGKHGEMIEMFAKCDKCYLQYKIIYEDGSTLCTYCGRSYDSSKQTNIGGESE